MNVLILTPDAVGSTLLQRLITIYMQFHRYDRPVINLHELTNGLSKCYNSTFNQDVLGKKADSWGYYQSLEQIVELLNSVEHYKTSRLAHYHIKNRKDTLEQQIPFYQYLNDNFFIISCRRHNVFEHALSWCLSKVTKKLNVYTADEKINNFFDFYKTGIDLDPNSLIQTLNAYRDYTKWCDDHFNVANYFYYDEHLPHIEKYILGLPIFAGQPNQITWKDKFDIDFNTWNCCHYLTSDIGTLALDYPKEFKQLVNDHKIQELYDDEVRFLKNYQEVADPSWPNIASVAEYQNLPEVIRTEVEQKHLLPTNIDPSKVSKYLNLTQPFSNMLPAKHQEFINQHQHTYQNSMSEINHLINSGVMISSPPIKKQTLAEKKHIIKNYSQLLDVYNQWIQVNPDMGLALEESTLDQFAQAERDRWNPTSSNVVLSVEQTPD
jgi:hypothetical protein